VWFELSRILRLSCGLLATSRTVSNSLDPEYITMAFVNEFIPEADKQRIDFSKIKHPRQGYPISPSEWTIDRERNIALIDLGGGFGEHARYPHFFMLYWQGEAISVFLHSKLTGNSITRVLEITWRLELIGKQIENVPVSELIDTLKEALFAHGYISMERRDKIKAHHFDFDGKHMRGS
jgi:hypothetical protein